LSSALTIVTREPTSSLSINLTKVPLSVPIIPVAGALVADDKENVGALGEVDGTSTTVNRTPAEVLCCGLPLSAALT